MYQIPLLSLFHQKKPKEENAMKTKYKLYPLIAIMALAFSLTSCERVGIDIEFGNTTNGYHEATGYLCSRPWSDEWYDNNGVYHYQELIFFPDHTGEDYMLTRDRYGYVQESSYTFAWDWYNSIYTSIRMKYGPRDFSYMDNIAMGGNQLNCLLDGEPVYFMGR